MFASGAGVTCADVPACHACPVYDAGRPFIPDTIRPGASCLVLTLPGTDLTKELALCRTPVSVARIVRCAVSLPAATLKKAATYCHSQHFSVPEETRLIVAHGKLAAQMLGIRGAKRGFTYESGGFSSTPPSAP